MHIQCIAYKSYYYSNRPHYIIVRISIVYYIDHTHRYLYTILIYRFSLVCIHYIHNIQYHILIHSYTHVYVKYYNTVV